MDESAEKKSEGMQEVCPETDETADKNGGVKEKSVKDEKDKNVETEPTEVKKEKDEEPIPLVKPVQLKTEKSEEMETQEKSVEVKKEKLEETELKEKSEETPKVSDSVVAADDDKNVDPPKEKTGIIDLKDSMGLVTN